MSQDVITNKRASEPLNAPASIQPWSADSEADKLMDDLFSDIDRILEGGSKLPTEPVKPDYVSLKSLVMPQITMPPAVMSPLELVQQPSSDGSIDTAEKELESEVVGLATVERKLWNRSLGKILLGVGVTTLVVMAILLLTNKIKLPGLPNFTGSSSTEMGDLSASDSQFISYMQRSLEVIDRKTVAKSKPATATNTATIANLPPVPTAGNRTLAQNQAPTVLERVYVPVYPPAAPPAPSVPSVAARPSIPLVRPQVQLLPPATRPSVQRPSAPVRSSVPLPPPATKPSAPAASRAAAPSPRLSAPPSVSVPNSPSGQSPAPPPKHTLVGLLELGDRSAALFDVTGVTQRIMVGEAIGASGWILVSVANQEAVIRRNGEVRSIYVGQKF